MKIISIQSLNLEFDNNNYCYHNGKIVREELREAYQMMYNDYNQKYNTSYNNLFWGFNKVRIRGSNYYELNLNNDDLLYKIMDMIGVNKNNYPDPLAVYLLEVPDEVILETDFYNFSDYIYMTLKVEPGFTTEWKWVYDNRHETKQVVFPFIKKEWIMDKKELKVYI